MKIDFPPALPVSRHREKIGRALLDNQVVIVCGDTGSGKTTQLPKIALQAQAALAALAPAKDKKSPEKPKLIGCTQPRRIAATSVAKRVAQELSVELGKELGYQIRFDDRTSKETVVKFMTDGILLAETQGDPSLRRYGCIIVDEAHERSLNIDFILGYLQRLLPRRPDLKIIISSATLDAESFSKFFNGAPVISVEGRTFPVEDVYMPPERSNEPIPEQVARAAEWLADTDPLGDTLVFLPGEREIRETADLLAGRNYARTAVLPLFARLAGNEQQEVFRPNSSKRRIILATNVAETSLTIPDIRSVIDTGVARMNRYDPNSGIQRLQIEPVSQASANQRRGRCGRVSEGLCVRLYDEEDFNDRPQYTDPEILRTNLAGVVLQMEHLRLGDPLKFPFIDRPQPKRIATAYRTLQELGAIAKKASGSTKADPRSKTRPTLTAIGQTLARLPLDPRVGRLLIAANDEKRIREGLILAAALTVQDPRERPQEKRDAADQAHAKFRDERSDFTGWLRLWHGLDTAMRQGKSSNNSLRRFCKTNYLNFRRTREWLNLQRELRRHARTLKWKLPSEDKPITDPEGSFDAAIHRAILTAIPSHIGYHGGKGKGYRAPRDRNFHIFPGSGVFKNAPPWVMAFELVETARLYARNVAEIDPAWVEAVAPHLVSYKHSGAQWNAEQGAVYGEERVLAFGLVLDEGRPVHYGRINPKLARKIFIQEALVNGETKAPLLALAQHREVFQRASRLEHKLRRRDGLLFPEALYGFYDERVPQNIHTQRDFEQWASAFTGNFEMTLEDCLVPQLEPVSDEGMPDRLPSPSPEGCALDLRYLHAHGETGDGINLLIPLTELPRLPDWFGSWLVPGWLPEKLQALLRCLHKDTRRRLPTLNAVIDSFLSEWEGYMPKCHLVDALIDHLNEHYHLDTTPSSFDLERLPAHLWMFYEVQDDNGNPIATGYDLEELRNLLSSRLKEHFSDLSVRNPFHRNSIASWDFGELPETVPLDSRNRGFPAICALQGEPALRVFAEKSLAAEHLPLGLIALYKVTQPDRIDILRRALTQPRREAPVSKPKQSPKRKPSRPDNSFSLGAAFDEIATVESSQASVASEARLAESSAPANETRSKDSSTGLLTPTQLLQLRSVGREPARNLDDLITLILHRALLECGDIANQPPRNVEEFQLLIQNVRGEIQPAAEAICKTLRNILHSVGDILPIFDRADAAYGESIEDAKLHLDRLLYPGWLAHAHPHEFSDRDFRGLLARLTRLQGSPAAKDLAKLQRLNDLLDVSTPHGFACNCPCGAPHPSTNELAAINQEHALRRQHFAPEIR